MHQPFDIEGPNLVTLAGNSVFLWSDKLPQIFGTSYIRPWFEKTTKFGMVTHVGRWGGVFLS